MNRRPLVIAAATVGVLATAAFALPNLPPNPLTDTIHDRVFAERGRQFATAADAPTRGRAEFALPSWIPKDATHVRVKVRANGEARLIRFTLGHTPLDGPQCASGTPRKVAAPELGARWWPQGVRSEARPECRDVRQYQVAVRGNRVYAWTDGTPSPGTPDRAEPAPAPRGSTSQVAVR
ncbi:hypothetical protein [Streptomyces subrutilus]|uniref:Secreted protein n=1 Tax=Streptomyces subrutilus TaxID=36818 RepID=A0A5P2UUW2_9ACTN|nr:hypothetical protein [Streptomyces subrutilus]QEU80537.1 hypothetical protein CP968_21590 [Streptomyces subrutilus]WSJ30153.1 hypothetical protein OG479_13025 [Streptomyces subrutilus]GGZ91792.1 hypothetical protein GCM10010371_59620 [Streptomyces subrutilus]